VSAITGVLGAAGVVACYHNYFLERHQSEYRSKATSVAEREFLLSERFMKAMRSSSPTDFIAAAQLSREAVVFIKSDVPALPNANYGETSTGSGVIMSADGYIMTNYHVVAQATKIEVMLNDNRTFAAKLIGSDKETDLALLQIDGQNLHFLTMGDSDSLHIGEWVMAIGNPFKLQSTVTAGIVSAKARSISILENYGIESFIQTDAAMNPGSSGGALINTRGDLMGICTAVLSNSGRYEGFSFAIPSNLVQKVFQDLRSFGVVQRGWLGIDIENVSQKMADDLKLDRVGGVYVSSVYKGGGAEEAGLKPDDVIISVNQVATSQVNEFMELLARNRPGDMVNISIIRDGRKQNIKAQLKNRINSNDLIDAPEDPLLANLGIELRELDKIERSKISFDGVVIVSVRRGSPIGNARMEPGYIVSSVNDIPVKSAPELIQLLKKFSGKSVVLHGVYLNYPGQYPYTFVIP
jgi:serine protease Do